LSNDLFFNESAAFLAQADFPRSCGDAKGLSPLSAAAELAPRFLPRRSNSIAIPVLSLPLHRDSLVSSAQAALAKTGIRSK